MEMDLIRLFSPTDEGGLPDLARDLVTLLDDDETADFSIITDHDPDDDEVSDPLRILKSPISQKTLNVLAFDVTYLSSKLDGLISNVSWLPKCRNFTLIN